MRENNITLSFKNIISFLNNITAHFTGKRKIITFSFVILMLSFTNITLNSFVSNPSNNSVSALSYSSSVGIGFTFNPTLSVSLSSSDLTISNLTPGSTGSSNEISVNVSTNAAYGYTLSATVGDYSTYNTDSLINSADSNKTFSSIATNADLENLAADNTWGYAASLDSGVTWSHHNGLSSSNSTTLLDKSDNTSSGVDFKISAKAGNAQTSGTYSNVISFTAVTKVAPLTLLESFVASNAIQYNGYYTMQSMTPAICNAATVGSSMQLLDVRDNKMYWVAKLADENCWMTQNLDLGLSHEVVLTSETSDIDTESYGKTIYTQETGYIKDEATGVVSWLPGTIDSNSVQRADTIVMSGNTATGWTNNNNSPYSADPGERYRYTNPTSYSENTYTSLATCASDNNNDTVGCQHSHFGNYYNWPAAAATNDASTAQNNSTWSNSICPKGWDLPANGKYGTLMAAQEVYPGSGNTYSTDGFNKLRTAPLYF